MDHSATDLSVIARTRALVGDLSGRPAHDCADDATLGGLGLDSIDVIQLIIAVDDHFDADLDDLVTPPSVDTKVIDLAGMIEGLRNQGVTAAETEKDASKAEHAMAAEFRTHGADSAVDD